MNLQQRLFDCVDHQLNQFPQTDMMAAKVNGAWVTYSTAAVQQTVDRFSAGLLKLGLAPTDLSVESAPKIAIISNNRPEWLWTDLAVQQIGAILIPVYPTTSMQELAFILNDTGVNFLFVSSAELLNKAKSIMSDVPCLQFIYTFDHVDGAMHWSSIPDSADETSLQKVQHLKAAVPNTHVATIIYTSGTTGIPKGVMLTHENIVSNVFYSKESFPFLDSPQSTALSFLPLNHIFEKCLSYIYMFSGISIYYAESMESIGENLKEVKPNIFTTVPRLLEKVFEKIMAVGSQLTGIKRKLFFWSVSLGEKYDNNTSRGFWYELQLSIANKLVFSKWREALGNNIEYIVTGGAACPEKLMRIFNAARIPVYEGYGPTENSPVITVNRMAKHLRRFGTVGVPLDGIEVKIEADGEICVKGSTVMKGYYKRPDLTAEAIKDGWLHTGDIGTWVDGKFLKITDRKKELFKTSGGKYVAPQPIENRLKESFFIEQVMVVGSERKFVGALIVPSFQKLQQWMKENGLIFSTNELAITDPKVKALYQSIINASNLEFNHWEQVRQFRLLPREWSIDSGEMTPKLSLKRKVVLEKFSSLVQDMYN